MQNCNFCKGGFSYRYKNDILFVKDFFHNEVTRQNWSLFKRECEQQTHLSNIKTNVQREEELCLGHMGVCKAKYKWYSTAMVKNNVTLLQKPVISGVAK